MQWFTLCTVLVCWDLGVVVHTLHSVGVLRLRLMVHTLHSVGVLRPIGAMVHTLHSVGVLRHIGAMVHICTVLVC